MIAVATGDVARAKLLRERGADTKARGRCGAPALFHAIRGHHAEMVRWLLAEGADVGEVDDFGGTALMEAVENEDVACVDLLLGAGADVDADSNGTALSRAASREIVLRLLTAGANPAELTSEGQCAVLGLGEPVGDALSRVSVEDFQASYTRTFGKSNPERMRVPFWEAMIRCGASAYQGSSHFGEVVRRPGVPVWSAQRFGQSLTLLPDGRAVQIGGEHEDYYDADFCIYNDVFVHEKGGSLAIYGYPESVFPPTDFHTATLIGEAIYVIGSAGYQGTRRFGETPVYRLDLKTFRMDRVETSGEVPGWILRHRAIAVGQGEIRVWGGVILSQGDGGESREDNRASFVLDLRQRRWRREG
ncbi:MAG: ankyrin repeat domain-containing protein [Polyangiaceae bacterium]